MGGGLAAIGMGNVVWTTVLKYKIYWIAILSREY